MLLRLLDRLALVRVTVTYAVIVTSVTVALYALGPAVQDRGIRHVSTNLHNLSHGHFRTLFNSAFVVDAGPMYVWLPGLVCLLALAELLWGSIRLMVFFAVGHIGGNLGVAAGLGGPPRGGSVVGWGGGSGGLLAAPPPASPRAGRPACIGWLLAAGAGVV